MSNLFQEKLSELEQQTQCYKEALDNTKNMSKRIEEIKEYLETFYTVSEDDKKTKNLVFQKFKIEWLLEQVQELKEENDVLKQQNLKLRKIIENNQTSSLQKEELLNQIVDCLNFYSNEINYMTFVPHGRPNIIHDNGKRARELVVKLLLTTEEK